MRRHAGALRGRGPGLLTLSHAKPPNTSVRARVFKRAPRGRRDGGMFLIGKLSCTLPASSQAPRARRTANNELTFGRCSGCTHTCAGRDCAARTPAPARPPGWPYAFASDARAGPNAARAAAAATLLPAAPTPCFGSFRPGPLARGRPPPEVEPPCSHACEGQPRASPRRHAFVVPADEPALCQFCPLHQKPPDPELLVHRGPSAASACARAPLPDGSIGPRGGCTRACARTCRPTNLGRPRLFTHPGACTFAVPDGRAGGAP
jgi:hypothetical protein